MFKHRTFILLASLLTSAFIASSAMASRGIVPVSIKGKSGNEIGLYKESHALVIGVSDYTNGWQDLESVPNEVNDLVSALEAQGFHVVKVMNPDSEALEKSFKNFINQYGFDPDNRLLFFYSGHGHTRQVGNITKGYLVPTDAPIPDNDPKGFKNKALSMKRVIAWAEGEIESKHALFLFDSCFSGTILKSRSKPPVPRPIKDSTNHPVRQFISAGSAGQLVPSQSVFTPYFIRALKGDGDMNQDGYVTGTELGLYLRDQIMGGDTHQTPQVGKSFNPNFNEGDFVFPLKTALLTQKPSNISVPPVYSPPPAREESALDRILQEAEENKRKTTEVNRKAEEHSQELERHYAKLESVDKMEENVFSSESKVEIWDEFINKYPSSNPKLKEAQKKLEFWQKMARLPVEEREDMAHIPGGEYMAGVNSSESDEGPEHSVLIDDFSMDVYEVTQVNYERVMGNNPSRFKGANHPVEQVNWHEAKAYCQKVGKRLPTEAEWEKAARGGTTTAYYWGNEYDGSYAWTNKNAGFKTRPVGQKKPNKFGLYDMSGNVWEWTSDWYGRNYYQQISSNNPKGPSSGKHKVLRGGSWDNGPSFVRSANRDWYGPTIRVDNFGFRCAR